jgi:ribosome-binding factor A
MPLPSKNRPAMLASVIREIIAPILRECPRECGIVSMTEIEVSPEYSYVTVLISALKEPKLALQFLDRQAPRLQKGLGILRLRKTPHLRFRIDEAIERGERIDQLLRDAEGGDEHHS